MSTVGWGLFGGFLVITGYAYIGYPMLLTLVAKTRGTKDLAGRLETWPRVSISVPAYNEEDQIRGVIESLLTLDYPPDRRDILIISDASTDATDAIVAEYASRGVRLLRMPVRSGKTAAENAASSYMEGDIVINTDASIRIHRDALKPLLAWFADPSVGVASGRDVSIASLQETANVGESGYVGYEMWVRRLETRVEGIVGASGSFYAIRNHLHCMPLAASLSRDFAAALIARENGYRSVSVDDAVCFVPRTSSLKKEYRRKVRTITRGLETLYHKRHLINPLRHGLFAWMLFSHKVCRWIVPWAAIGGLFGLLLLSRTESWVLIPLLPATVVIVLGVVGWALADRVPLPRILSVPAFALAGNVAAIHAALRVVHGDQNPVWEPTRREPITPPGGELSPRASRADGPT